MNTPSTYSFTAQGLSPAATFFIHFDGYPSGAALYLREMLLQTGESSARAFQQANQSTAFLTPDPAGDPASRYRYRLDGMQLVAEERGQPGGEAWSPFFTGPLVYFIHGHCPDPMLHATGERAGGGIRFSTLDQLEMYLAEAQGEALRYEAGVYAVGGATAAARVEELRGQVLRALRAERLAGRVEPGNDEPRLNTYTVFAEIWDNEQGYAATVQAVDNDAACELVRQQYQLAVNAARDAEESGERPASEGGGEDCEKGLLRIWAVVRGNPDVVYLRDAD